MDCVFTLCLAGNTSSRPYYMQGCKKEKYIYLKGNGRIFTAENVTKADKKLRSKHLWILFPFLKSVREFDEENKNENSRLY